MLNTFIEYHLGNRTLTSSISHQGQSHITFCSAQQPHTNFNVTILIATHSVDIKRAAQNIKLYMSSWTYFLPKATEA